MSKREGRLSRAQRQAVSGAKPAPPRAVESRAMQPLLPGRWQVHAAACLALVVATCVLYRADLGIGFLSLDDPDNVVVNPWIRGFSAKNLAHVLTQVYFAKFTPVLHLSYMLDHAVGGIDAFVFHLSSNLWAGATAATLYLLGVAMFGRVAPALAAAVLFVLHPVHVEAVAWISSRKDLVATAFGLAATLTYFQGRRAVAHRAAWYGATLALFLLAVGGKQSVVVLPVLWGAADLLIERRSMRAAVLDKLPFAAIAVVFAVRTLGAEPPTRHHLSLAVMGKGLAQSAVLLSGFGQYVPIHPRPEPGGLAWGVVPIALAATGIAAWRWLPPRAAFLYLWILLALVPQQAINFVHPVADRYLFLSSVGLVLLLGWAAVEASRRFSRAAAVGAGALLVLLAGAWAVNTRAYLAEWADPRSVWHDAVRKSNDPDVFLYLAGEYQDAADQVPDLVAKEPPGSANDPRRLADVVWEGDTRLASLRAEWDSGTKGGPVEGAFREALRDLAWQELEKTKQAKGNRVLPNLFFRRGKLQLDRGQLDAAKSEFNAAIEEAKLSTYVDTRNSLLVYCHHALGVIAWHEGDYATALALMRQAEDEQTRFGGRWVPTLTSERQTLEGLVAGR